MSERLLVEAWDAINTPLRKEPKWVTRWRKDSPGFVLSDAREQLVNELTPTPLFSSVTLLLKLLFTEHIRHDHGAEGVILRKCFKS